MKKIAVFNIGQSRVAITYEHKESSVTETAGNIFVALWNSKRVQNEADFNTFGELVHTMYHQVLEYLEVEVTVDVLRTIVVFKAVGNALLKYEIHKNLDSGD